MKDRALLRALAGCLLAGALIGLGPASVYAQDDDEMSFGEEDAEGGDDTDFDFSEEDLAEPSTEGPTVTGYVIRADPGVDASLTQTLSDSLMSGLDQLPGYQSRPNDGLAAKLESLGQEGALDCAYNPICLSRLGEELGAERLVVGRLSGVDGEYNLNLDLINVADGTVENYVSKTVKGDVDDLEETIKGNLFRLFGIRKARPSSGKGKTEPVEAVASPVQKGFAWGTAGLAAVCVGAGIVFGLQASSIESDLEDGERDGNNVYAITQQEAQTMLDDAESKATLANVFYGVGLAAAVTSALLFTVTFGEDIATEEELSQGPGLDNFHVTPAIAPDGESVGLSAGFDW